MRILLLNYNYLPEYTDPQKWIDKIRPFIIVLEELAKTNDVFYAGQIGYEGNFQFNKVNYVFINPVKNSFFPFKLHRVVKKINPGIVIVPGFHFPLQIIQLWFLLGGKAKIIEEYHADHPGKSMRKILQKLADRFITAYHFTSLSSAGEWKEAGIIRNQKKCVEISSASVSFIQKNKIECRNELNIPVNDIVFIWVGRLNLNKDPFTVLKAFEKYTEINSHAVLKMIYHEDDSLDELKAMLFNNEKLKKRVALAGFIPHQQLSTWYSAADYFISGSRREGGSLSLLEAMACGCIPVVTDIPPALKVIENGALGFFYEAGNAESLFKQLKRINEIYPDRLSNKIVHHFNEKYSAGAISAKLVSLLN